MDKIIHCVTTMDKDYYNLIGKLMIHTWLEYFPKNYKLHLFLENFSLDLNDERVVLEKWDDVQTLFDVWYKKNKGSRRHQGFTKKALSQIVTWNKYSGSILWLDADLIFFKSIPSDLFSKILGEYPIASWGPKYFESGTVFLNTDHISFHSIKKTYEDIYIGGLGLPTGERWFDGELLGYSVFKSGVIHKNLADGIHKSSTPLNKSWIGDYMKHYKSKRKDKKNLETALAFWNREDLIEILNN